MMNIPWGGKEMNVGVEDAPDYILTPEFLSSFKDYSLQSFVFPKPEAVDMAVYFKTIADYSKKFADMITKMQEASGINKDKQ